MVAVVDADRTKLVARLVEESDEWIVALPWLKGVDRSGKNGTFEQDLFEAPDFTPVHGKHICISFPTAPAL